MKSDPLQIAHRALSVRLFWGRVRWAATSVAYGILVYRLTTDFDDSNVRLLLMSPIAYFFFRCLRPLRPKTIRVRAESGEIKRLHAIEYVPEGLAPSPWGLAAQVAGFVFVFPAIVVNEGGGEVSKFFWMLLVVGFALTIAGKLMSRKKAGYLFLTSVSLEILDGNGKPVMRTDRASFRVHEYTRKDPVEGEREYAEFDLPTQDGKGPYRLRVSAADVDEFRRDLGANYSNAKLAA
ncbi:MAG: hypothetical protein JST04_17460 [Bdellovibrionales bacterium]|nr:hypothetical protein [Bdellovibrionales bacterium]